MKIPQIQDPVPAGWVRPGRRLPHGGRRSGVLSHHQLACTAGGFGVDVLAREMERPRGLEIAGQLTWEHEPHVPAPGVLVALVAEPGQRVLARTRTSAFGDFTFDQTPCGVLGLCLGEGPSAPSVLVWEPRR